MMNQHPSDQLKSKLDYLRPTDHHRLENIEHDPKVIHYFGMPLTSEDIDNFITQSSPDSFIKLCTHSDRTLGFPLGVYGHVDYVPEAEANQLQGWIYFYQPNLQKSQVLKQLHHSSDNIYLEVSYAKLSTAKSGQLSAGLRQSLDLLSHLRDQVLPSSSNLVVSAFIEIDNQPSIHLIQRAGFKLVHQFIYTPTPDDEYTDKTPKQMAVYLLQLPITK